MAADNNGTSMAGRTGGDLIKLLMELQASGSIHFHEILPRKPQHLEQPIQFPTWFVEEHGDKIEEWVILRSLSSASTWIVHLDIRKTQEGDPQVQFCDGWKEFVADNRLQGGEFLIFVLNTDPTSEFQVYDFRGVDGVQVSGGFTASEEAAPTSSECKSVGEVPPQHGINCMMYPSFCRRILRCNHKDGRMEIPAKFVRKYWKQLRAASVKVQGVHQDSRVRVVELYWNQVPKQTRLYFQVGWREFVEVNGLQEGQELQFTLIADSSFTVRVV